MKNVEWQVWALGYDENDMCTDVEIQMGRFKKLEKAMKFSECFETIEDFMDNYSDQLDYFSPQAEGDYIEIRVEEVDISDTAYHQCINVVYERKLTDTDDIITLSKSVDSDVDTEK